MDSRKRMPWIDWMKAIGMYFIVLGHFFSQGTAYVYVFNVPLFFVISGFLCRREENNGAFWRKLWWNLVVPMLVICGANFLHSTMMAVSDGSFGIMQVIRFVPCLITGMHRGVGVCWFVYTLVLLKIIHQYIKSTYWQGLLAVIGLSIAYALHEGDYGLVSRIQHGSNAIINVCIALPFFLIGVHLRGIKDSLNNLTNWKSLLFLFVLGLCYLRICGHYNGGSIWMYTCQYGKDIFWFLVGGLAGTLAVYALSKLINRSNRCIETISTGTIIILGFHGHFIRLLRHFLPTPSVMDFVYAAIIVLIFIPVIHLAERYFPLLLGRYRAKK